MKNTKQGVCPKCKKSTLSYGEIEIPDGSSVGYPYICYTCKFEGTEWYLVKFDYHMDKDGNTY